jgi:uncharacterized protein (DUF58 family)
MTVTGRFTLLVALGVVPVVLLGADAGTAWAAMLGWLALALGLGAIDISLAASPRRVALARELPGRLRLGETATSELEVRNLGSRRLRAVVRDGWTPSAGVHGRNRAAVDVPPGESRRTSLHLTPTRRGDRRTEAVTVRSIDWRATARRADPESRGTTRLMVRTWRPERDRRIVIVADTSRTAAARVGDEPRLDTAFETALLLAALASHAGDRVDFLAWDRRLRGRVHGASGPDLLARMVDVMAGIEAELIEADWAGLPAQVRGVTSRRALVVLVTAADSPGTARGLLSILPQLATRHRVLVASVADPELAAAVGRRDDLGEVYAAAAAERSRLDAGRVAAAIRHLGASTVSATPLELPPAVADRYLELKAAGQL